ncbi:MAG TPA: hypothetical protein ENK55_11985 [Actinobacteria bacterium]|nr:hypothetical protein [Actinomycetota bacterium]
MADGHERRKRERRDPEARSRGRGRGSRRKGAAGSRGGRRRRDLRGRAAGLPNFVIEALERVTPPDRVAAALEALGAASAALAEGRFHAAYRHGKRAKDLAPRDATVRETLGLAAYRLGEWETALRELRTYRRMTGEPDHLPVEMDVLRALGRDAEVERSWRELQHRDARTSVRREGAVVYASYLLDAGRAREAWELVAPRRLVARPSDSELRTWYVAARAAAALGDAATARKIADAIVVADPGFPGIDELEREIRRAGGAKTS